MEAASANSPEAMNQEVEERDGASSTNENDDQRAGNLQEVGVPPAPLPPAAPLDPHPPPSGHLPAPPLVPPPPSAELPPPPPPTAPQASKANDLPPPPTDSQPPEANDNPQAGTSTDTSGGMFKAPMAMNIAPLRRAVNKQIPAFGEPSKPAAAKADSSGSGSRTISSETDKDSTKEQSSKPVVVKKEPSSKSFSPTEQLKQQQIPIPYMEPKWGGLCSQSDYYFEVIKNGTVVDSIELKSKSYFVFGRLPSCDITMEHPSLSRYHAVVQYCAMPSEKHEVGWYLYDLDSTHGTWVNKNKVRPRVFIRLRVGYVVKLGGSTRLNILQGPDEDQDAESELTVTEIKEQRERQKKEAEVLRQAEIAGAEAEKLQQASSADQGCSWGMDDAEPEEISSENPFALDAEPKNEELYIEDPKKALRGFFEREGCDLPEYEIVEESRGKYKCRVELPIDGPMGEPIIAEATMSGKKKEVVAACALEACRILDRHGELRKSTHEGRAKKKKNWEDNDFYDSDEDTFLDRTGDIEKKRKQRMNREKKSTQKAETYESLVTKLDQVDKDIAEIEEKLQTAKEQAASFEEEGLDAFDAYMMALKSGVLDTKTKTKFKRQIFDLKQEKQRLQKLANVAKPALPGIHKPSSQASSTFGALFGKKKILSKTSQLTPKSVHKPQDIRPTAETEEVEEEEDESSEDEKEGKNADLRGTEQKIVTEKSTSQSDQLKLSKSGDIKSDTNRTNRSTANDHHVTASTKTIVGPERPSLELLSQGNSNNSASQKDVISGVSSGEISDQKVTSTSTDYTNIDSSRGEPRLHHTESTSDISSTSRQKGPSLPSHWPNVEESRSSAPIHQVAEPSPVPFKKRKMLSSNQKKDENEISDNPDYATWVPPKDQSGDGMTHLNAKYGY